jgi:hypothetical protein
MAMAKELNCETLLTSYRRTLRAHVHGAGNYELIDLDNNARSEATGATSMGTILWSSCGIALSESQRATLNV